MVCPPLQLQTITEILGQTKLEAKGTSQKAFRTADRAGLAVRSRRVIPNSQSSTSAPARCHSSVQEKTKAPAHPDANVVRICHSSTSACSASPLRKLSKPTSLM